MLSILPQDPKIIDEVPNGRLYRDGHFILEDDLAIRVRRKISTLGSVTVSCVIDGKGNLMSNPSWSELGVPHEEDSGEMQDIIENAVNGTFKSIPAKRRSDKNKLKEALRRSVRSSLNEYWGKKPVVTIHLHQI